MLHSAAKNAMLSRQSPLDKMERWGENAVDVKTYNRLDVPGPRIGFIAQDLQRALPAEFANIMGMQYGDQPLLALSYDRLVCVLWGAVKALTARVDALELLTHP